MKRTLFFAVAALMLLAANIDTVAQKLTFGYLNYTQVLQSMPDYATAQTTMQNIRAQYDKEAAYNEDKFFKMYSDYIQGQKTFPEDIMLKRQKELQVAMDQGIKFREESEKLLRSAEAELCQPLEQKLDSAIAVVAKARNLAFVLNTEQHAYPFINPNDGIDITSLVNLVLAGHPLPKVEEAAIAPKETVITEEHKQ
ncbi:MAG: OmpH family outer membrane protein [Bacteroidaceae bacterium]|nr:OmpH family outer membrane protein [Bacteroidaceae bacterium]